VLLGLLVAAGFALAVARTVLHPLTGVAAAARRVSETGELRPVAGADRGDEIGTLARSFNDMTARLLAAKAGLEDADRRKDEFLAMLSHELRNPLTPISNALHVLRTGRATPEQAARSREVIARQVEHLTRLVDDLLDVTRISRGKIVLQRGRVDLTRLARLAVDDVQALFAERGLELRLDAAAGELWVDGDATRLTQAFGNLLQNAAKFTPRGGRVCVHLSVEGGTAEVRVTDTGVGMEPELLEHVFEPFVQADRTLARSEGGLGLGLALVKGVVELHGGSVRAVSGGAGAGSEFALRLPLVAPVI
jgi:signal transduction histidine kinase